MHPAKHAIAPQDPGEKPHANRVIFSRLAPETRENRQKIITQNTRRMSDAICCLER